MSPDFIDSITSLRVVFSTLSNLDLIVKIKDTATMEIESIFIERESVYELIKEVQGRQGFPAQLG